MSPPAVSGPPEIADTGQPNEEWAAWVEREELELVTVDISGPFDIGGV